MIKKFLCLIFLILNLAVYAESKKAAIVNLKKTLAEEKKENADDPSIEFKETRFLQLDRISVPNELKSIEEQVKQNIVDVVLVSKTHTPVYAQKRAGYSDSYKKFYGLQVQISPYPAQVDSYQVHFFYYNWTTNKFDKTLYKVISKYNVINEVRFGTYELLFGKKYVDTNRDALDIQNYERIQAVRKSMVEQARLDKLAEKKKKAQELEEEEASKEKKKSKLIREDKDKEKDSISADSETDQEEPETSKADASAQTEDTEEGHKDKINSKVNAETQANQSKKKKKPDDKSEAKNEASEPPAPAKPDPDLPKPEENIKLITSLSAQSGGLSHYTESLTNDGKIKTFSNFRYLGFGGHLNFIQDKEIPRGYTLGFEFGVPVMKGAYPIPIYHQIQFDVNKYDFLLQNSIFGAGIEYSPINFVNIPNFGDGFQVFENDFLWARVLASYSFKIKKYDLGINLSSFVSVFERSSQKKTFNASKYRIGINFKLNPRIAIDANMENTTLAGDLTATTKSINLHAIYYFEN